MGVILAPFGIWRATNFPFFGFFFLDFIADFIGDPLVTF
ncbi:hypothetical protein FHX41_3312 [Actinomadura hallensis]|uniref:Uncharacterized protein n=1 Tax=Actinomadura hallensis TaxID=337895 RepID=A0A543IGC4_9ACTN|nr:hypothetical protein FHX41_3312 [Actinomadura hallensis]